MTTNRTITIPPGEYNAEEFHKMASGYTSILLSVGVNIYAKRDRITIKWPTPMLQESSPFWAKDWKNK